MVFHPSLRLNLATRLSAAATRARHELLAARGPAGHWTGELSSSALSTATAVTALALVGRHTGDESDAALIRGGLAWLARHANSDGGWGDTILSFSNISTTALCWAAFGAVPGADTEYRATVAAAGGWLARHAGGLEPDVLATAIIRRYGRDRTFSVPILTMCALAGRLGQGREAWRLVLPLPFELAACPSKWFAALRLPVVSYALPALIAIGQAAHYHRPSANPLIRIIRHFARRTTLEVLAEIQPSSGGFLEATPLTSFVTMSLAASGQGGHSVTCQGVAFLRRSARPDGSWPIDADLATWVTTLAVNALEDEAALTEAGDDWDGAARQQVLAWLLRQQYHVEHPYTRAAPGGWAWTDLPGGVPDADDTPGALLSLRRLGRRSGVGQAADETMGRAVEAGVAWLLGLQNADGGMPTFCRGWGALPFDRSSPDLTAHALRAWVAWRDELPVALGQRVDVATGHALAFLARTQAASGAWTPLWFGNQHQPSDENPTYGTARVLVAIAEMAPEELDDQVPFWPRAAGWLVTAQNADGSWGGFPGGPPSVEETALAVEALAALLDSPLAARAGQQPVWLAALRKGVAWLVGKVETGEWAKPSPIGFYFAKLWYYERLYPQIFTVGALNRAARVLN